MAKKKKYPFSVNAFLSTVDGGRTIASYRQNQTTGPALGRQRPSDTRHLVGKRHRRDPERFDHLGPLAHQKIARPMQHQLALLLARFDPHKTHGRAPHCLADRFRAKARSKRRIWQIDNAVNVLEEWENNTR